MFGSNEMGFKCRIGRVSNRQKRRKDSPGSIRSKRLKNITSHHIKNHLGIIFNNKSIISENINLLIVKQIMFGGYIFFSFVIYITIINICV